VSLAGFFVAALVVALMQFVRTRERRLIPLLALFACLAVAHSKEDWRAARQWHLAAGLAGLVLVVVVPSRHQVGR
jgi:hypothetical protein